jgi:uncharacterized RDD family membrane protein YckC
VTEAGGPAGEVAVAVVDSDVFYARIWPRMKALLIDGLVLGLVFFGAAVVGANISGAGAAAFLVWFAIWVLYDPLMVWRTGGTIGHHVQNLKVVSDRTGRNPSLLAALVRNFAKGFLGVISLLAMAGSRRKKALHDLIAGTTVQARDAQAARLKNFVKVRATRAGG